ncbi:MAG TPA: hypothetical protein VF791_05705 [Pyrinomonadaceae bacterium]
MNLRKHLAGFAIFSIILGSTIFIYHFLIGPNVIVPRIQINEQLPPLSRFPKEKQPSVGYKVRLVSLDFINQQSYTVLSLRRQPGQPLVEKLWITTVFFTPNRPSGKILKSVAEIRNPFANTDKLEYVAASPCDWCSSLGVAKDGYFARVYVSSDYSDSSYPPDVESDFDSDITTATQVVVQAERKIARP